MKCLGFPHQLKPLGFEGKITEHFMFLLLVMFDDPSGHHPQPGHSYNLHIGSGAPGGQDQPSGLLFFPYNLGLNSDISRDQNSDKDRMSLSQIFWVFPK